MRIVVSQYFELLVCNIPNRIYVIAGVLLIAAFVVGVGLKGWRKGLRYTIGLLCLGYVGLLYCSTLIFRPTMSERHYDFTPFWSYNHPDLIPENIMNVIVFIPIGLLAGLAFPSLKWRQVILIGFLISMLIETLQYCFMKGFSEFDDVFHNTVGAAIGYGMYKMIMYLKRVRS